MDRREALTSLAGIPGMVAFRAELKKGDVIVLECPGSMTKERMDSLQEKLKEVWPNHRSLVLTDGLRMNIISGA